MDRGTQPSLRRRAAAAGGAEVDVHVQLDDTLQIGLDCVAQIGAGHCVAYGWTITPRGTPGGDGAELLIAAGAGVTCTIDHGSFHPRPDLRHADPSRAVANGFTLVFETPEDPPELVLTLAAGDRRLYADLRDPRINADILRATAERSWFVSFGLLRDAAAIPAMGELLRHGGRPMGIFADWLPAVPMVRGLARDFGALAEVEAVATPAGEVLVMLRTAAALPPEATLSAAAIAWLREADGAAPVPVLADLADWHAAPLPAGIAGYGRLDPALLGRLHAVEVVVQAVIRPGEAIWLRAEPSMGTAADLLDAAGRSRAANQAPAGPATKAFDLLKQVVARREAAFGPTLAALAAGGPNAARPQAMPRFVLILGAEEPGVARLFHVAAAAVERHCDRLLVLGAAADEVAQVFERRGHVEVLTGIAADEALREAAGRAGVVVLDAAAYAEAIIAGQAEAAFDHPLDAADIARLLALHAAAGCAPALADSLRRLLRARQDGPARFAPVARAWGSRMAAEIANAHLQRLWATGAAGAPALPEPAAHG